MLGLVSKNEVDDRVVLLRSLLEVSRRSLLPRAPLIGALGDAVLRCARGDDEPDRFGHDGLGVLILDVFANSRRVQAVFSREIAVEASDRSRTHQPIRTVLRLSSGVEAALVLHWNARSTRLGVLYP